MAYSVLAVLVQMVTLLVLTRHGVGQIPDELLPPISGLVALESPDSCRRFIAVHDFKKKGQPRLSILSMKPSANLRVEFLKWPERNVLPIDLEAITAIPSLSPSNVIVVASSGNAYHCEIDIDGLKVRVAKEFVLPNIRADLNLEGFSLQYFGEVLYGVWGHRGKDEEPGMLYWAQFRLDRYTFSDLDSSEVVSPLVALKEIRHISDLRVDQNGSIFISSASDPGDDGPFSSELYLVGKFQFEDSRLTLRRDGPPRLLARYPHNKVEAIEIIPGAHKSIVVGSDDENHGAVVTIIPGN